MHGHSAPDGRALQIAVVGGGASGTLAAMNLLRRAADEHLALHVTLIDGHGRHGRGQAYSTGHHAHLLNAMAAQMSAWPDDPDHLIRWAQGARAGGPPVSRTTFLSRPAYGQYLRDALAAAERQAAPSSTLTRITAEVLAISREDDGLPVRLSLGHRAGRSRLDADAAVLATGNAPGRLPFEAPRSERIITDPWLPGALDGLLSGNANGDVVVIGSGLTMLDVAIAVTEARPGARVHAISRHGLLPRPHPGTEPRAKPMWLPALTRTTGPVRLSDLMWQVRSAISASPANWHSVLESLRPITPGLWRRMSEDDKRLFLRHVARYWEVHRHLMPPATAARVTALRCTGQLSVHRGRVRSVREEAGELSMLIDAGADAVELTAGWLVNGTGASADITAGASPLLRNLFASGLARPDSLRLGIDATAQGNVLTADGEPSAVLYALGPPLRGLWYETTAVPEIRTQAAALAARIIGDRQAHRHPGSAA